MTTDPHTTATKAAEELRSRTGVDSYDVALVMGSGWAPAADTLGAGGTELPTSELTGFLPPAVEGHSGTVRSVRSGDRDLLVFLGRTHLYEGHGADPVAHGVRTAVAAGASTVILTNAAGSLDPDLGVGSPVLIADHINLTGQSPLRGATFVDLTDTYSAVLRAIAKEVDPSLPEGVYAAMPGPHFETPAEIRMLRAMGADLVGMSTALEAIAAREAGASVLGLSLVTNIAAGLSGQPLDHEEVLAAGRDSATDVGALLASVVERLDAPSQGAGAGA
ncbi:purine-nucleoside phosphorylase [Streptomonospora litoralis]|uniref:Purine nucleoside phosphorylase n=1 Tax=Streptomonospora litoralis TaxID=2498135 RepID=A0A4P6PYL6_9ACTN|nr:purine-nucleoside phosphorylase [Streptomonospora litoralis]QBI53223.1 Purine nucleoside phosphorylase [Streptomonospora litoralis]